MSALEEIIEAGNRMKAIIDWHLAAPLVDHDGGDEDDRLVEERRFLRAIRKPRSRWFRQGDRVYVVQEPEIRPFLIPFRDPGDEDRSQP